MLRVRAWEWERGEHSLPAFRRVQYGPIGLHKKDFAQEKLDDYGGMPHGNTPTDMSDFCEDVVRTHRLPRARDAGRIAAICHVSGRLRRSLGTIKDISMGGVYFYADFCPQPGTNIRLMVTFPAEITYARPVAAVCKGKVVRVETDTGVGRFGIAVEIGSYERVVEDA